MMEAGAHLRSASFGYAQAQPHVKEDLAAKKARVHGHPWSAPQPFFFFVS